MSPVRVRFAPSPTGMLHVGGARTALFNWLFARHHGGTFVLRIEDTDQARDTPEANEAIFTGLQWLGLSWDEGPDCGGPHGPYRQSQRGSIYDAYLSRLDAAGVLYVDQGAVRFRSSHPTRTIPDLICGETVFAGREEPDMTIRRADGSYIFHFVNVVDDIEMRVTHVIRGEDHLPNTPRHLDLYDALGVEPPAFAHIPLILNPDGSKMSKRDVGASVAEYIAAGYDPDAVANYLALLGWSPKDDREILTRTELVSLFSLAGINRGNARFDLEKCAWMSGQSYHGMDCDSLRSRLLPFLAAAGTPASEADLPDPLLAELRIKIRTLTEAVPLLLPVLSDDFPDDPVAMAKLRENPDASALLGALTEAFRTAPEWTAEILDAGIATAAAALGVKKGSLMFPCRVALTGQSGGFGLMLLLERLGRGRTLSRLVRAATIL